MGAYNTAPQYRPVSLSQYAAGGPSGFVSWSGCRVCHRWAGSLFNLPAGMLVECTCGTLCRAQELTPYDQNEEKP